MARKALSRPLQPSKDSVGVRKRSVDVGASSVARIASTVKRKYHNQPVDYDGHHFDSKAEAARYMILRTEQMAGLIRDLEVHPRFPLVIHEQDCGFYAPDFAYITAAGERVLEDVKSPRTAKLSTFRLKAKMIWALYGLRVREVMA